MCFTLLLSMIVVSRGVAEVIPDPPITCAQCERWNEPLEPFQVFGNTYYVGTGGLSAILIVTDDGLILLDGALPQSAPLIDANIRALGFRTEDIELIGNSHTHYDHAGGIAALQRASGAVVVASPNAAAALEQGGPTADDPQAALGGEFPAVAAIRVIANGETLRVGDVAITAHFTPGHTPGGTTWAWQACEQGRCLDVVYADSLNPVSADEFRFSDSDERVAAFRSSIERVKNLRCDILLAPHPDFIALADKLRARRDEAQPDPFVDPTACGRYAEAAAARLDTRLAEESARAPAAR